MIYYRLPGIDRLEHSACEHPVNTSSPNALQNCPRAGGSILTIYGNEFGLSGATVFIGPKDCKHLVHDPATPTQKVTCTLPSGWSRNTNVFLIQDGGAISPPRSDVFISYEQCPIGTFQNGFDLDCEDCPNGQTTFAEGSLTCDRCSYGLALRPAPGYNNAVCTPCPPNAVTNYDQTDCHCPVNFYRLDN